MDTRKQIFASLIAVAFLLSLSASVLAEERKSRQNWGFPSDFTPGGYTHGQMMESDETGAPSRQNWGFPRDYHPGQFKSKLTGAVEEKEVKRTITIDNVDRLGLESRQNWGFPKDYSPEYDLLDYFR
ncbi:MAG: hypothetical protein JRG73_05160 [Deltaproteobacteria bacterium]|nr:hypothetical protein [Deltaproteobacteria bacterium]MBW2306307.1 hypothetical protein [Deltaproteobacteria bacterium]